MPKLIVFLLAAILIAACKQNGGADVSSDPSVAEQVSTPEPMLTAPPTVTSLETTPASKAELQVGYDGMAPLDPSWNGLLETLPSEDRKQLQAMNSRYFGALAFGDESEKRRLQELGFPTAEQVLKSSKLTDGELKAKADSGDVQAQMVLVDRLLVQAEAARANKNADPEAYETAALRAMSAASMLISRTKSPFGAYLDGRANWQLRPGTSPEIMAASMMVASDLGDWRAKAWLQEFQRQNPGMDTAATLSIYNTLRHTWRVR